MRRRGLLGAAILGALGLVAAESLCVSGVYPHLAMTNREGECGTGAVVPWAGSLWAVTYAPHAPVGSSDKLYQIKPDLTRVIRPESVGGTPAERLIHRETGKLLMGVPSRVTFWQSEMTRLGPLSWILQFSRRMFWLP